MTKLEILEAVLELAYEKGLGNISMSQIAEKVNLKKSSLYSHFHSKDEIIESMYEYFRMKAKLESGIPQTDYSTLFEGHDLYEILTEAVSQYRMINSGTQLNRFYRLIMAERVYDSAAAQIMTEETVRMVNATKNLFYALSAKKIAVFDDPDAAAFCFAMGVHSVMDFEYDAEKAGMHSADGKMILFISEFCRVYGREGER